MTAAVVSKCVWDRFATTPPRTGTQQYSTNGTRKFGRAATENLLEYIRSVPAADADALESHLEDRRPGLEAEVKADAEQATEFGVSGVLAFVVFDSDTETAGQLSAYSR